jgi:hypothetical protein
VVGCRQEENRAGISAIFGSRRIAMAASRMQTDKTEGLMDMSSEMVPVEVRKLVHFRFSKAIHSACGKL